MKISLFFVLVFVLLIMPLSSAHSQLLEIPCTGVVVDGVGEVCDFPKLVELGKNIITFLLFLSIPLAAIAFAYAGFLFITAAGSEEKVSHAKEIFTKVAIGFLIILSAWLIVKLILVTLLSPDYQNSDANLLTLINSVAAIAHHC